jgi:hypothetical protein
LLRGEFFFPVLFRLVSLVVHGAFLTCENLFKCG